MRYSVEARCRTHYDARKEVVVYRDLIKTDRVMASMLLVPGRKVTMRWYGRLSQFRKAHWRKVKTEVS